MRNFQENLWKAANCYCALATEIADSSPAHIFHRFVGDFRLCCHTALRGWMCHQSRWAGFQAQHNSAGHSRGGSYGRAIVPQTPYSMKSTNYNAPIVNGRAPGPSPIAVICQLCNNHLGHSAIRCVQLYKFSNSQDLPKSLAAMSLGDVPSTQSHFKK